MAITKTNGVSFSLVAGACCIVRFSGSLVKSGSDSVAISLNINSTGAKNVETVALNKHISEVTGNYRWNNALAVSPVVAYTGSTYIIGMTGNYRDYSD